MLWSIILVGLAIINTYSSHSLQTLFVVSGVAKPRQSTPSVLPCSKMTKDCKGAAVYFPHAICLENILVTSLPMDFLRTYYASARCYVASCKCSKNRSTRGTPGFPLVSRFHWPYDITELVYKFMRWCYNLLSKPLLKASPLGICLRWLNPEGHQVPGVGHDLFHSRAVPSWKKKALKGQ